MGIAAFAAQIGLPVDDTRALVIADFNATGDDTIFARCLSLGSAKLARLAGLSGGTAVDTFIADVLDYGPVAPPPELAAILRRRQ
jgi:hypothetical protein